MKKQSSMARSPIEQGRPRLELGMSLMAVGVLMVPGMHAIAKGLGDSLSSGQIAWARLFFQFVFLLPVVLFASRGWIPRPSISHALRGFLLALGTLAFFWAVTFMPLADSSAIFFVEPLILTTMSAIFLGERIGVRRMLAVVTGFGGALVVIRPSFETVGLPALLPLVAALCFAIYLTITRHLANSENAQVTQFWVCFSGMLSLSLAMALSTMLGWTVMQPTWPTLEAWGWLVVLGIIATASHMLAILAFRLAPASVLAPFQYFEIVGATILGVLIFGDFPDLWTSLGITIIVASGLYVFRREQIAARQVEPSN